MPLTRNIPCMLCNSTNPSKIKTLLIPKQNLCKCRNDGLVYLNQRLGEKEQKEVYEKDILKNAAYYRSTFNKDTENFGRILDIVRKFGKPESVIDIGSSTGTFLWGCAQRNIKKLFGVEINKASREYSKKRFGFRILSSIPKKGKFDLVNLSDVIEHLQNPLESLKDIRKLMHKNSLIAISTPNFDSIITKLTQVKPEEHLYYFTKKTLRKTLQKAGFEAIYLKSTSRNHSVENFLLSSTVKNRMFRYAVKAILFLRLDDIAEPLIRKTKKDLLAIAKLE